MVNLANPTTFVELTRRVLPWLAAATLALFVAGLWLSFAAPPDYQQGETVKIMYLHVPAAWMATFVYAVMTAAALGTLVWRHPLADAAQKAAAPLGAGFTFICLVTGSLWGKPMWGTYWVWDARLTSVLVLFILYLGLIALWRAIDDPGRAAKAAAILTLGRRRRSADHQILGRLVEHVASARVSVPARRSDDRARTAHAAAGDVARLHVPFPDPASDGDPQRNPAPADRSGHDARGGRGRSARTGICGERRMMGDPHVGFIVAAYAVAVVTIGAMIGWVVSDFRHLRAQLDQATRALDAARGGAKGVERQ